ncbi:serine/threonine-protein kinase [Kitasatospora camelliae]|uniref:non-specific serine/threonine protein kinase n=1 Tax=Kitasatospora camelliae TaxID=3156397 RepID=A0AAU8K4F9_9ACTN
MWGRGTVLGGRYTLTERVGGGGMGEVWRADDGVLERQVAVKIMHPGLLEDRGFTERFRREARILATLRHPGIVHVHDYGEPAPDGDGRDGGDGEDAGERIAYIVMEFIDGKPLNEVLAAQGPMVPARALGIVADALDALHVAHQREIVHRDLKPSNLMLRSDGGVTVTDFGIAHAMAGTKITTTNSVLGTALYIAPEQADGQATSPRSDLYSIGVVCFELLTGRLPFTGETVLEIVLKHIQQPAPQLSEAFPQAVREFVATALAKDPAERHPNAAAMAAAARAAAARPGAGEAVRGPTVIATVPAPRREPAKDETPATVQQQRRRSRLVVPIVIPVVISIGVGTAVLIDRTPWHSRAEGTGPDRPGTAAPLTPGAVPTDPAASGSASASPPASPSPTAGDPADPQATPGQQPANPAQVPGGAAGGGGAAAGGAAGGGAAGGGGGTTATRGTTAPPANTPPPATPEQPSVPQGCGGNGWGYVTGVGSGQRLGLAADSLAGGTDAVMGRNTAYGWVRSAPDPGGWYTLSPCNMSKPVLVQNTDSKSVELSPGFSVLTRWTVASAPTQGAVYLKDYSSSTCLTDNGSGRGVTMETCTPGNKSQQWYVPPSG